MKTIIDLIDLIWFLFLATIFVFLVACGILFFIAACIVVIVGGFAGFAINSFAERTRAYRRYL